MGLCSRCGASLVDASLQAMCYLQSCRRQSHICQCRHVTADNGVLPDLESMPDLESRAGTVSIPWVCWER